MSICNATNLGSFSTCQEIEIVELVEGTLINNIVTGWQCPYDELEPLNLAPGYYQFEISSQLYEFRVV